mmetsp:Transcript_3385/g.10292  ORF Transcript_3385/g.10292 Transcript_3385/m.10292 type:complete len:216 (-) Transcript_3385:313-960(-)
MMVLARMSNSLAYWLRTAPTCVAMRLSMPSPSPSERGTPPSSGVMGVRCVPGSFRRRVPPSKRATSEFSRVPLWSIVSLLKLMTRFSLTAYDVFSSRSTSAALGLISPRKFSRPRIMACTSTFANCVPRSPELSSLKIGLSLSSTCMLATRFSYAGMDSAALMLLYDMRMFDARGGISLRMAGSELMSTCSLEPSECPTPNVGSHRLGSLGKTSL